MLTTSRVAVLLTGYPRRHRAGLGCLVHERVESARPLQPPLRPDTRHLRYDRL
jgi:hypothetical protein